MDEQIRAIQEYIYGKYIEPGEYGGLDEEAASLALEEYYSQPERENDSDCYFVGVLYFELGYEIEEKQVEYFRKARHWLEKYRVLTSEEWDAIDDRLLDIEDIFEAQGIEVETSSPETLVTAPARAPHIIEEIDDHGPMMLVAGGCFLFGPELWEMNLSSFYIDKYPVTNRTYEAFCRATGYRWPRFMKDERFNHPDSPVVGVSLADALRYCRWVGKTLPTQEQWEKACRGSDGRCYPWGDEEPTNGRACHGRDPLTGGTDPVTAHADARSPYGVEEMAGNVWEWTATTRDDGEPVNVVKGGCYNDPGELLRGDICLLAVPKDKYETIGFRCAKSG